jgi:hypothetical protein
VKTGIQALDFQADAYSWITASRGNDALEQQKVWVAGIKILDNRFARE